MIATTGKIYAIVTFLSVLVLQLDSICVDCHLPPNATEEEVERFVILDFKRRLMERLGLKTEPKIVANAPNSIISAITTSGMLAGDQPRNIDEEPSKINSIVFGPYAGFRVSQNRYSFKFQIKSKLQGSYELAGVKIWIHANKAASKRHWFQIYDKTRWGRNLLLSDSIGIDSRGSDWKAFKLVPNKDWYRTPWKTLHLEIEGINEGKNGSLWASKDQQPRLEVRTRFIKKRVYKRSTSTNDCPKDGRCCKHTMSLNLKPHIPWLVMPINIQALVCRGSCPLLYRARWLWSVFSQIQRNRKPCCVPTKLSPISVIHRNADDELISSELNDMIVVSCGCS